MQGMGDWLNSRRHFSAGLLPLITAVSLLLIFPAVTLGAALTWVGTGADADFMTAGNWSPAQQPTTSDSCTINSTSNLQPSILTNATCGSLTLGTGASLMTLSFTAAKNFDITGDVTIGSNGRLAASGGLYNGVITVGGNWTDPAGTTNLLTANMQPLFIFTGSGKTLASNETFYQLRVNGGSITLGGNITITDFLDITNGSTLTHGNYTITHNGTSFTNGGTYNFTCGSTLSLYGTIPLNNDYHYPNVVINSGANVTGGNTAYVDCDLTIQSGSTFTTATSLEVGGSWINNGGTIDFGSGTVTMTGSGKQITGTTATTFNQLVIGNGSGDSVTSSLNLTFLGDFTVVAGASFTQTANRSVTVNGASTLDGSVYLSGTTTWSQQGGNKGITVGANGLLSALGTNTSNRVTFTSPDGSFYNLIINGGLDFNNVNVWYTQSTSIANSGFRLLSPITATVNFNNVAINYVNDIGSGSVMMLLNAPGGRVINSSGCTFDSSTFDVGSDINVEATAGTIVFTPYSGNWSGEALDNDNGGTVTWGDRINLVSGRVFEDANFSGTAAGWDGGASDKAMANVDVELYNNANAYISSTTTAADGTYSFANILDGTYKIRVRSATIGDADTVPQGGFNACVPGTCAYPIPTMTWANTAARYGGQSATADDTATGDNAGPGNTYISLTLADADVANVDFGFAYNLIVSADDDINIATTRSKAGTLRQFIKNANSIGAGGGTTASSSQFRMQVATNQSSGSDAWWRITPGIALPTISDSSTTIDGTTQTTIGNSNSLGPEIEIFGSGSPAYSGLSITSANNTVKGIIISGFSVNPNAGIYLAGAGATGNTIAGNYIGTNYAGTAANPNFYGLVSSMGGSNIIGGSTAAERNIISGNSDYGIVISSNSNSNTISGNYIGTNAAGSASVANKFGISVSGADSNTIGGVSSAYGNIISGNSFTGIDISTGSDNNNVKGNHIGTNVNGTASIPNLRGVWISSSATGNTIGGTTAGERNLISGNSFRGVVIGNAGSDSNFVYGNYIGTDINGTAALANAGPGVHIQFGAKNNTVGGTGSGQANVIAFNSGDGVWVESAATDGNIISGNSIFSNTGLGIDLDPDGIGTGTGANNDKPRPTITGITPSGADFTTVATVTAGDIIEFFRVNNAAAPAVTPDPAGSGEGYLYLGKCVDNGVCSGPHISAVADANAAAGTVQATLLSGGFAGVAYVTATATDATNGTSEFAANVQIPVSTTMGDGTSPSNKYVYGNDTNMAVDAFTLSTSSGTDTLTGLTVTFSGTTVTDVAASGVKIYRDNGTTANEWDASDTLIATGSFSGATATFSGLSIGITTTSTQYLITYDMAASPGINDTLQGSVTAATVTNTLVNNDSIDATLTVPSCTIYETAVYKVCISPGRIKELYLKQSSSPTTNVQNGEILFSFGYGDTSGVIGIWNDAAVTTTVVQNNSAVYQLRYSGAIKNGGGTSYGSSTSNVTFYRDRFVIDGSSSISSGLGTSPQLFCESTHWTVPTAGTTYRYCNGTPCGSVSTITPPLASSNYSTPFTFQVHNELGATDGLATVVTRDLTANWPTATRQDAYSAGSYMMIDTYKASPVIGTTYRMGALFNFDIGTGFNDSLIQQHNNDYITPATISFTGGDGSGGSFDAPRDIYTLDDGDADDHVKFTFQVGSYTPRFTPVFEITNWNTTAPSTILVGGVTKNINADYIAAVSGTTLTLQYLSNLSADTVFEIPPLCPGGVVTTTVDNSALSVAGSLRECINYANSSPGTTISFNIPGPGNQSSGGDSWWRISPASALPTITANGTIIDGTTQTTNQGNTNTLGPEIEINGAGAGAANGIAISSANNTIRGLIVNGFNQVNNAGFLISGAAATNNIIAGNYVGTNYAGTAASANRTGIQIQSGANGNTIGGVNAADRNIISGNTTYAITITGAGSSNNTIKGNYIGTTASGTASLANNRGIYIVSNASANTIGGSNGGDKNVISANTSEGIYILGTIGAVSNNVIKGNYIGTDVNGTTPMPNNVGIKIESSASSNTIGGSLPAERNLISGNAAYGINILSAGASNNVIKGNYIGTDANGISAIPNGSGIVIEFGAATNTVGGAIAGDRNIISGNTTAGIQITGTGTSNNVVKGNYIGTDVNRTSGVGNGTGISFASDATSNIIGSSTAGEGNTIAFNTNDGIMLNNIATDGNIISANSIFSNGGLGIDILPNDIGTGSGANNDKARPTITSITPSGANFTTIATVTASDTIEFFRVNNAAAPAVTPDGTGSGEGYLYLGKCVDNGVCSGPHISAVADANAAAGTVQATLLSSGLVVGDSVSATATDPANGTSEFSANVLITGLADLSLIKTDNPDPAPSGGELLYTLLITNSGPTTATGVTVTDNLPASVTFVSATPSQGSCSGTTTVTCNLGSILNTGTASVEILVVTSGSGSITNSASVTGNESDPVPGNNSASINTQVVVGGTTDIPLTQYRRIHGFIDYAVTGGSLRTASNSVNPCTVGASSSAALSGIPAGATIVNAYLYWAGSGSTVDSQITLDGTSFTADRTWQAQYVLSGTTYDFFGGFKDVTAQVQAKRNGNYTFSGLSAATGNPYCSLQAVLAGWSMIVIYQDSSLSGKTLVLYDGLDIARNGSTAYTLAGIYATAPPEGKATYLTWEGDSTLSGTDEKLVFNGTTLSDGLNPSNNVYNSTINNLGVNNSYGVDLDTFNVSATINARDSLASTTVSVGPDLVILNAVVLQVTSNVIVGKIFEDVNYGGGAGRDLATAVAGAPGFTVPRPNATVELYDAGGSLIRTTSTAANGEYGFTGLPDGNYTVRVVNSTVTSSRAGYVAGLWPVQTFRTDASTGTTVSVTNEVGGAVPANQDSGANVTSANLGSFFSQSKAPVQIITGIAATSVDFGFNFNTVVNKNDTGQGSLRQFISNANTLSNASLAQSGRTAGLDNAIFMLADGTGRPGLKAGYPSMFASGIATIGPASALPDITSPAILDAATQPGYGGTPMIEINGNGAGAGSNGFRITAGGSSLRGFIINRFGQSGIELSGSSGSTVQACYLGTDASGAAGSPNGRGILIANSSNNTIGGSAAGTGNLIAYNSGPGVSVTGGTGNLISRNSIYANTGLGIDLSADGVTMNDNGDADTGPNDLFNYPILTTAVISGSNIVLSGYARPGSIVEVFVAEADPTGFGEGKTYLFTATEGGGSDGDAGTGNYGPGAINGLSQGTDTTNRFIITVPLPGGVVAGTILTATATDGSNNTSEFSGKVTVQSSQYRPDAMIKLSTEGDPTYLTDNTYEGTAIVQIKSLGVLSGSTAAYTVKFQNDGNLSDTLVITGTGSGSGFTVQYLDETAADRTAAVTGAGYSINGLAVGGSKVWTLNITPAGNPTPVVGGTSYNVIVTATSSGDGTKTDQLKAITTSTSATLTFLKSANKATYNPGEDIAYTMTATNMAGLTNASNVVISDPIPANTGFKIAGATFNAGTSTLTATISYSNNNGATWVYTPVSGGCAAPAGYDYCATNVRWTMSGNMPQGTNFSSGLVVRVK